MELRSASHHKCLTGSEIGCVRGSVEISGSCCMQKWLACTSAHTATKPCSQLHTACNSQKCNTWCLMATMVLTKLYTNGQFAHTVTHTASHRCHLASKCVPANLPHMWPQAVTSCSRSVCAAADAAAMYGQTPFTSCLTLIHRMCVRHFSSHHDHAGNGYAATCGTSCV